MTKEDQLAILKQGAIVWNKWRDMNFHKLYADGKQADFRGADLGGIWLVGANLENTDFREANLGKAQLGATNFRGATLSGASLSGANLYEADLSGASLNGSDLRKANFSFANLRDASLVGANLNEAELIATNLNRADCTNATFREAILLEANFNWADLRGVDLRKATLNGATLVGTKVQNAKIHGSNIYGINIWDLDGEFEEQEDLVITPNGVPTITVDNVKVAQFIYLILNNEEIRTVIHTLTSRSVLILGRFAIPERKAILDALKNKLREYNLFPIVFDFDRPTDKDFTETIKTLAGLSCFVIADVTNPKSSPLELQATVPDYQIPFVPIIQEGENPFAMMVDLQKKYNWMLNTVSYDLEETLMRILQPLIIDPAMKKRQELRLIKAQEPEVISGKDFLAKGGF